VLPRAGDIYWVELDPVSGTEQAGRRPALFISEAGYHELSTRAVICPITAKARGWPFEVRVTTGLKTIGVVLVDQVRTIHRATRIFDFIEQVPPPLLDEVRSRLGALLGISVGP
jgi:mRNA interferase MazF